MGHKINNIITKDVKLLFGSLELLTAPQIAKLPLCKTVGSYESIESGDNFQTN